MEDDPDLRRRVNVVRSEVPAVTHVDYSARLQTVDEVRNPRFYRLLEAFDRLTGCPVLVNTSFNVRGEPIVCTPAGRLPLLPGHRHGCPGAGGCRGRTRTPRPARPAWRAREAVPGPVPARLSRRRIRGRPTDAMVRYPVRSAAQDPAAIRRAVAGLLRRHGPLAGPGARAARAWGSSWLSLALVVGLAGLIAARVGAADLCRLDGPGLPDRLDGLAGDAAVMYFGLFTPIGLVFRLIGRDPLHRARRPGVESYWTPKPAPADVTELLQAVLIPGSIEARNVPG